MIYIKISTLIVSLGELMSPGMLKVFKSKIDEWKEGGVTLFRMLAQLDKWKKKYGLTRDEAYELERLMGVS